MTAAAASTEDTLGVWEPHTSSIDFCESNYLHQTYIVEPHNVWSSVIGIAGFGLWGWYQASRVCRRCQTCRSEWLRLSLPFAILTVIGLGSAGLHGTLHWVFQSSDELPMIYYSLALLYACAEVHTPAGSRLRYPWLPMEMLGVSIVLTVVYYTYQDLYAVFVVSFLVTSTLFYMWHYHLTYRTELGRRSPIHARIFRLVVVSYSVIACTAWVLDMVLCHAGILTVANRYCWGMTPHVLWHFAAGHGAYCGAFNLMCLRLSSLDVPFRVRFWLGVVPRLDNSIENESDSKIKKP